MAGVSTQQGSNAGAAVAADERVARSLSIVQLQGRYKVHMRLCLQLGVQASWCTVVGVGRCKFRTGRNTPLATSTELSPTSSAYSYVLIRRQS